MPWCLVLRQRLNSLRLLGIQSSRANEANPARRDLDQRTLIMYKRPLNIDELKEYWNIVDGGESIENLPICYMPPWNDICSKLEWELHLTDDGYFPKKTHAVCGGYRLVGLASEGELTKTRHSTPSLWNRHKRYFVHRSSRRVTYSCKSNAATKTPSNSHTESNSAIRFSTG